MQLPTLPAPANSRPILRSVSGFWFLLLFLPILAMAQQAVTGVAVVAVIVVQALLIAGLLFQRYSVQQMCDLSPLRACAHSSAGSCH